MLKAACYPGNNPHSEGLLASRRGFTLIEMAIVVVIAGILISIVATVLPSLINSSKIRKARAILEKADYALQGYITANGQCPCPDTTGDGREDRTTGSSPPLDDTCAAFVGALPYVTLGLSSGADVWQNQIRYGVYEDMVRTTTGTLCADPPCSPCLADFIGTPNTTWLRTGDGATTVTVAYVLASGGIKDMDGDNDFFDGRNASAPITAVFESPDRIMDNATYDDLVYVGELTYLQGRLCTGSGGGTTIAGAGAENAFANGCDNSIDDDGDGYIDCLDQDCFNISPCGTGGTNVTITTASLASGVVNESYLSSLQATGGITPYQWSLSDAGGFSGLFLHTYTAQLSGRLDQCPGTYTINVHVTDTTPASDGGPTADNQSYNITVASNLYMSRTSGSGTDILWLTPTQEETFEANGGHLGDMTWSLNTGGANGFTVTADDSSSCTVKKNGETTTGTGPYTFTLTATDAECPSNGNQIIFTVTIPASGTGAAAPYTVGMEAQWHLDECTEWDGTSYDIEDSFGNPMHFGRRVGNVTGVHNGKICRAASFGGGTDRIVSDVLTGSDIMAFSDQVTLACWFKSPGGGGTYPRLIEFSDATGNSAQSTAIAYDPDGSLRAWVSSEAGVRGGSVDYSAGTYNDDAWHHVVYTYNTATGGKLYVDGNLKVSGTSNPTSDIHDAETFVIGGYYPDGNNGFVGLIDEVAVFQRELTPTEVVQYYNVTRSSCPGSCYTAPVAEYRMENAPWEGTSGEVYDTGSGGSNGTAVMYGVDGVLPAQTESDSGKICRSGVFVLTDVNGDETLDRASGGYLDMTDPADDDLDPNTRPWSVCAWINWDGTSGENIIYNKENLYEARVITGQVHYAWQPHWVWDGGGSFAINANTWTHVATVYQGTEQTLFRNGGLVYRRYQAGAIGSNANKLLIGARGSSSPRNFFRGMIDEVRIYDRALSQSEILSMVNETRSCP